MVAKLKYPLVALALAIAACSTHTGDSVGAGAGSVAQTGGVGATAGSGATAGHGAGSGSSGGDGSASGCQVGDRHYAEGAVDIPAADGCNTCSCNDGTLACTLLACEPDLTECVVARRIDMCCGPFEPHVRADLADDECLVAYSAIVTPALKAKCAAKSPIACEAVDCDLPPFQRVARKDPSGACVFADECTADTDCIPIVDARNCCECPAIFPKSLLSQDPCLHVEGDTTPAPAQCDLCNSEVECFCPVVPVPTCTKIVDFKNCIYVTDLGD